MIAKVKIAPVEQWCEALKALLESIWAARSDELEPSSGSILGIFTESMRTSPLCGGREWRIAILPDSLIPINSETGKEINPEGAQGWVCEHILEMD